MLDAVYDFDHIGTRLALDVDDDCRRSVGPSGEPDILGTVHRIGDLGQFHRGTVTVGDNQFLVFRRRLELVIGINDGRTGRTVKHTLGLVYIGGGNGVAQVFQAHVVGGQCLGIGPYPHGRTLPTRDADQPDPWQLGNLLCQPGIDQVFHLGQWQNLRTDGQSQDRRIRRVDLVVNGRHR